MPMFLRTLQIKVYFGVLGSTSAVNGLVCFCTNKLLQCDTILYTKTHKTICLQYLYFNLYMPWTHSNERKRFCISKQIMNIMKTTYCGGLCCILTITDRKCEMSFHLLLVEWHALFQASMFQYLLQRCNHLRQN